MPEIAQPDDRAYCRDASWYDRPDVTSVKKLHLPRDPEDPGTPRCSTQMLLDEGVSRTVADVPPAARCQRNGCRQGWPS